MTARIENLRPHQISDALAARSLIYLPLGTIEWHSHHLPVGLDAATAHALCLAAAEQTGGLVWPPLYFGTGGGHADYPWTVMMPEATEIETLLFHTLRRLSDMGVARCVLFSGHFADEQLSMIDRIAGRWNSAGAAPLTFATAVNRCPDAGLPPDHAGEFETLLMMAVARDQVDLPRLSKAADTADRHDPENPIWGVIGADPRAADVADAQPLFDRMVRWLVGAIDRA